MLVRTALPLATLMAAVFATDARAQVSSHALRVFGTGTNQQDRVRIRIDDDAGGPDASAPCDVGAGSFTLEFWLRGFHAENSTTNAGGDVAFADYRWIDGNVVFDRDVWGGTDRDFGASVAGGFVRFGVGRGDAPGGVEHTLEGSIDVLDGAWHHVALVRDASSGRLLIHVDGVLDMVSPSGVSFGDLSYPNAGAPGQVTPWGPFLVLGAEKHDAGPSYPSFAGWLDEVRVWNVARTTGEIAASWNRLVAPDATGLVANWRFEEGSGTVVTDSSAAGSPAGDLVAGQPGNGEWVAQATSPVNTAPIAGVAPASVCAGDGSSVPCPCGNASPAGSGRGCATSVTSGGLLVASGDADVSSDSLLLSGSGMPDGPALYFQGSLVLAPTSFGDGLRCAGGTTVRLAIRTNVAGSSACPPAGSASLAALGLVPTSGGTRTYQVWFRDAGSFCTSATFNTTNALRVVWTP